MDLLPLLPLPSITKRCMNPHNQNCFGISHYREVTNDLGHPYIPNIPIWGRTLQQLQQYEQYDIRHGHLLLWQCDSDECRWLFYTHMVQLNRGRRLMIYDCFESNLSADFANSNLNRAPNTYDPFIGGAAPGPSNNVFQYASSNMSNSLIRPASSRNVSFRGSIKPVQKQLPGRLPGGLSLLREAMHDHVTTVDTRTTENQMAGIGAGALGNRRLMPSIPPRTDADSATDILTTPSSDPAHVSDHMSPLQRWASAPESSAQESEHERAEHDSSPRKKARVKHLKGRDKEHRNIMKVLRSCKSCERAHSKCYPAHHGLRYEGRLEDLKKIYGDDLQPFEVREQYVFARLGECHDEADSPD